MNRGWSIFIVHRLVRNRRFEPRNFIKYLFIKVCKCLKVVPLNPEKSNLILKELMKFKKFDN